MGAAGCCNKWWNPFRWHNSSNEFRSNGKLCMHWCRRLSSLLTLKGLLISIPFAKQNRNLLTWNIYETYKGSNFWASIVDLTDERRDVFNTQVFSSLTPKLFEVDVPIFLIPWWTLNFSPSDDISIRGKIGGTQICHRRWFMYVRWQGSWGGEVILPSNTSNFSGYIITQIHTLSDYDLLTIDIHRSYINIGSRKAENSGENWVSRRRVLWEEESLPRSYICF